MEELKEEWKGLIIDRYGKLQKIDIETFRKQFMDHPKKAAFMNWKDDEIAYGATMLICAIWAGRFDLFKLLLEHGADITIADEDGNTALMWASMNGHADIVKLLLEKDADFHIADEDGWTALMLASENGHVDIVKLLLEKDADVTNANKDGNTALSLAIEKGHNNIVKLLLGKGAEPNILCNSDGQTFLHLTCLRNQKFEAQSLLEAGINKDLLDGKEHTALFYAAEKGFADVVDLLMKYNADVNKTDERRLIETTGEDCWGVTRPYSFYSVKDGRTPLFVAAQNGHQYVVATLLHHGADPYRCNHESKIPRDVSKVHGAIQQLFRIHRFFEKREKGDDYEQKYKTCKDGIWEFEENKGSIPKLEDIIHDIVKYPHNADKFLELYRENRKIVNWLDKDGRSVEQVACKECRVAILFMGQYKLDDQPNYESPTCKIYNALDYGGPDENLTQPREVAMKFFEEEEHFENELRSRQNEDGTSRFSSDFVTPYFAAYRASKNPKFAQACKNWKPAAGGALPGDCIVMPRAKRSLLESVNAENLSADHKDLPRRQILSNLCNIFSHIHQQGYVHGDIKPHNVVRHMDDGNVTWKAIDFDACTKIGEVLGLKLTTGSAPPEMFKVVNGEEDETEGGKSRVILRKPNTSDGLDESELVKADPSFDVWSFGILMYQLVTGKTFFHCNNQGNLDDDGLHALANLTQADLTEKIDRVKDINSRVLLSKILHLDPKKRPTMAEIGQDHYFHPSASPQGRQAEFFQKKGFDANMSKEKPLPSTSSLDKTNEATVETKDEQDSDHDNGVKDLKRFQSSRSEFSYFTMRDEDKDWSDQLLKSEVKEFSFDNLEGMGEKPKFIDGDSIYNNPFLRDLLYTKGPDYFMGFLVEYFELYKIMSDAHQVCQENKVNLVSDVKSLKGIFIKLFVRGKGLNDIVRGTLFCNSVDLFTYVGTQLKQNYGHNVYIKPPKPGTWPIPKLLVYGKNRIDGRCMSVEIQFSTVYMHLAAHASNSHVVYEAMREATDYLDDKDEEFRGFLKKLDEQYIDTEGFLPKEGAQEDEGRFEILVGKADENASGKAHTDGQESSEQYTTEATGLILSGRVRCGDYKFQFMRSEDGYQKFSESSFVVNKSLTLLSSHSYWSEELYDLEGKSVEFVVSFKGRGLAIAGIGTTKCFHGATTTESGGGGDRCSLHVGRSKFMVRKSGAQEVFQEKKLPNQERAKIVFKMKEGTLLVSFIVGSSEKDEVGEEEIAESQVSMPLNQRYYLYMRAPPGVHDVKFHEVNIK